MYFGICYTKTRNCLALRVYSQVDIDKDLGLPFAQPRPLVVFNPKTVNVSRQIDFAFTFEKGPSDYLCRDDNDVALTGYTDYSGALIKNGTAQLFEANSFDELMSCIDTFVKDASMWNVRHKTHLTQRASSLKKYAFDDVSLAYICEPWTGIYKAMGMSVIGTREPLPLDILAQFHT